MRAASLYRRPRAGILGTLAAAYAEAGRFSDAVKTAHTALDIAVRQKQQPLADTLRIKIALYETGKPFREVISAPTTPPRP